MCKKVFPLLILLSVIFMAGSSCVNLKSISYLNDLEELNGPIANPRTPKKIKPNDILYIRVVSTDSETTRLLNYYESGGQSGSTPSNAMGYTVDNNGDIDFPFIGKINLLGLTADEAQLKIYDALGKVISNYTIIVRYLENKISVLGEVRRPGPITFNSDVLTIYEALAAAGGIAETGNFKKVVLIRQEGDNVMHYRLNLNSAEIASKPYYYIQPNDVILVEPSRVASWTANLPDVTSVLGIFTSIITLYMLVRDLGR